jgi:hypothetical protein
MPNFDIKLSYTFNLLVVDLDVDCVHDSPTAPSTEEPTSTISFDFELEGPPPADEDCDLFNFFRVLLGILFRIIESSTLRLHYDD